MADTTFLKSLFNKFNGGWWRAFKTPHDARQSGMALDAALEERLVTVAGMVPVGAIIWWHKDLAGTPALPANFVECNGQVLSDADSVYNGATIPDINGGARFIRGSATSGTLQAADAVVPNHTHTHNLTLPNHQHMVNVGNAVGGATTAATPANNYSTLQDSVLSDNPSTLPAINGGITSSGSSGSETRPINISMVAIMRIK